MTPPSEPADTLLSVPGRLAGLGELVWFLLVGAAAGLLAGYSLAGLAAGGIAWGLWMLVQGLRLANWLRRGALTPAPEAPGLWGEIFYRAEKCLHADSRAQGTAGDKILQQIFSELEEGAVLLGPGDSIEWCNEAAVMLLGLHFPEDRGQPLTHLIRMPAFADFLQQSSGRVLETHFPPRAARRLQFYLARFSAEQGLLFIRDITAADNLERVRHDFTANLSHELRIPLTVLIGYLEMLTEGAVPDNPAEILEEMRAQAQRMSNLVTRMMDLARLESAPGQAAELPVDTAALLERVSAELRPLAAAGSPIRLETTGAPALLGEETDLASAFANLVANAIRATSLKEGEICVRAFEREGEVLVEVEDKGIGMEAHHLPRITERFYRANGSGSTTDDTGSGLGLAIVKHVLDRHGATLLVESSLGQGSLFRCVFPPSRRASGAYTIL